MAAGDAVLVTGASSGIGRATALRLDAAGMRVFAGVRKEQDGEALRGESRGITPVQLDVSDAQSLQRATDEVTERLGGSGLSGLVNNAGISGGAPVEFLPLDELRRMLEVNVVGVVATTQAFLPLVRQARGRIVCTGSIGGRFAVPFLSAYSMSKAAVSAFCDSLRGELRPWGIHVALIEPGSVKTPIWDKGIVEFDEKLARWPEEAHRLYGDVVPGMRRVTEQTAARGISPDQVAKAVEHALTAARPRTRYLVGIDARAQAIIRRVPDRTRDALVARQLGSSKKA